MTDFLDAVLKSQNGRHHIVVTTVQLHVVIKRVKTDDVFRDMIFKIRSVQHKQTWTEH